MNEPEAFSILGLHDPQQRTAADIRRAFQKMAAKHHPDRGGNHEQMQAINRAYEHLTTNPAERRKTLIEQQATELLVAVFGAAIDKGAEPVAYARQKFMHVAEELRGKKPELEAKRRRLERASGKTTIADGENLVQMLIEQRLGKLARDEAQLAEAIDSNAEAQRMLARYVGEPPAQPSFNEITFAQIAQMAGYGYGRGNF